MSRPRTGTAYLKHGVVVLAIKLRNESGKEKRFVMRCPERTDGQPLDLIYARAIAAELQRRYDAGEWVPTRSKQNNLPKLPAIQTVKQTSSEMTTLSTTTTKVVAHRVEKPKPLSTTPATKHTVLGYVRNWVATQKYESAPKDASRVEVYLAKSPIANIPIEQLKAKHILLFVQWLVDRPSLRGGTLAPRTIRNIYDVLRRALDIAVIDEVLPVNPCNPIRRKLPSIEDKDPTARQGWLYSKEEIVKLMTDPHIQTVRRVCYAIQFLTGMRVGELAVLRWKDYDTTTKPLSRLTVSRAVKSVSGIEGKTKTSAVKLVPVHPTLATVLNAWYQAGWNEYMERKPTQDDLIVPNQFDMIRDTNKHNRDLKRDCKRIGIPRRHQHAMRHTFITLVQDDGADGSVIRWITHAPPRTAFDSYTRVQWQRLCVEMQKFCLEV